MDPLSRDNSRGVSIVLVFFIIIGVYNKYISLKSSNFLEYLYAVDWVIMQMGLGEIWREFWTNKKVLLGPVYILSISSSSNSVRVNELVYRDLAFLIRDMKYLCLR